MQSVVLKKLNLSNGSIFDAVGNFALESFISKDVPYLAKKTADAGRYYASEAMRDKKLQKKDVDNALDKLNLYVHSLTWQALDQFSTEVRPTKKV